MSKSVFHQLVDDPIAAKALAHRSQLMRTLAKYLKGEQKSNAELAKRAGVSETTIEDLFAGHIDKFTATSLQNMAVQAGLGTIL